MVSCCETGLSCAASTATSLSLMPETGSLEAAKSTVLKSRTRKMDMLATTKRNPVGVVVAMVVVNRDRKADRTREREGGRCDGMIDAYLSQQNPPLPFPFGSAGCRRISYILADRSMTLRKTDCACMHSTLLIISWSLTSETRSKGRT